METTSCRRPPPLSHSPAVAGQVMLRDRTGIADPRPLGRDFPHSSSRDLVPALSSRDFARDLPGRQRRQRSLGLPPYSPTHPTQSDLRFTPHRSLRFRLSLRSAPRRLRPVAPLRLTEPSADAPGSLSLRDLRRGRPSRPGGLPARTGWCYARAFGNLGLFARVIAVAEKDDKPTAKRTHTGKYARHLRGSIAARL